VLKILCFQSLFSENDQFCSPAKQTPLHKAVLSADPYLTAAADATLACINSQSNGSR
jgi:hypothetical protein